jgi:CRP-like cAMP-binding protein
MFPPYRWSFDARTMTSTEALALDGSKLRDLKAGDHELGYELMTRISQVLINRLQATRLQLLDLYEHGR